MDHILEDNNAYLATTSIKDLFPCYRFIYLKQDMLLGLQQVLIQLRDPGSAAQPIGMSYLNRQYFNMQQNPLTCLVIDKHIARQSCTNHSILEPSIPKNSLMRGSRPQILALFLTSQSTNTRVFYQLLPCLIVDFLLFLPFPILYISSTLFYLLYFFP